MTKTSIKINKMVSGEETIESLEINVPVYLDIKIEQYCDLLEILPIGNDTYKLICLWETEENGIYTAEEEDGSGYCLEYNIKLNTDILNRAVESKILEDFESSSKEITVDDLYVYSLEECHMYNDNIRNCISLESYNTVELRF